jgi:hypothetical protein
MWYRIECSPAATRSTVTRLKITDADLARIEAPVSARWRCLLGLDLEPNCLAQGTQVFHRDLDSRHVLRGRPLRERRRLKAACRGGQVRVIDDDTNIQRQLLDRLHMLSPLHAAIKKLIQNSCARWRNPMDMMRQG